MSRISLRREHIFLLAAVSLLVSGLLYAQLLGTRPLTSWVKPPTFGSPTQESPEVHDTSPELPPSYVVPGYDDPSEIPPEYQAAPEYPSTQRTTSSHAAAPTSDSEPELPPFSVDGVHPIDHLLASAQQEFDKLNQKPILDSYDAATIYRKTRGRHPPPGFDKWVSFALLHQSRLNEHFFDQIYEDLEPFWGMKPSLIREFARSWDGYFSIRNGSLSFRNATNGHNKSWIELWTVPLTELEQFLPDLDFAVNNVDEPRIMASYANISEFMRKSIATRHTRPPTVDRPILNEYTKYPVIEEDPPEEAHKWFDDVPFWHKVRDACHPDSGTRDVEVEKELNEPPRWDEINIKPYVTNGSSARNICENPEIRNLHGMFLQPGVFDTSRTLVPLFSACKIAGVSNDILLPAAKYFDADIHFSGGDAEARHFGWHKKKPMAVWRGSPTGGQTTAETWRWFHRQRLVSMLNATSVRASERLEFSNEYTSELERAELSNQTGGNFPLPKAAHYDLAALKSEPTSLGAWTSQFSDAGFITLMCRWGPWCDFMVPWFHEMNKIPLPDMFKYKYVPDVDGMSYSGRYRSFLESTSLPFKATIFSEWHDSRLVPWYHYVPMDNSFVEWWGLMEYFAGYDPAKVAEAGGHTGPVDETLRREPHDLEARDIANQGQFWAERTLRREDMIVYMYRLLLEYARVCDDRREDMGWTGDLDDI